MKESRKEAERWWNQAQNDLGYAELGLSGGYYAQACFQCHQVAEKALKAVHYAQFDKRFVAGHSLVSLSRDLDFPESLKNNLPILDQYYIPTRYPNGLPDSAPYEVYTAEQAQHAVQVAREVLEAARKRIDL